MACAKRGLTCCQGTDRDIYITPGDVKRISDYTRREDFYEYRKPINAGYLESEGDPAWIYHVFRQDGSRRVLKATPEGNCTFLSENGCRLPLHIRPIVCRLHPYEYNAGGFYNEFDAGCPVNMLAPGRSLVDCLDMDPADAARWHRMLYEEIILEKKL